MDGKTRKTCRLRIGLLIAAVLGLVLVGVAPTASATKAVEGICFQTSQGRTICVDGGGGPCDVDVGEPNGSAGVHFDPDEDPPVRVNPDHNDTGHVSVHCTY